MKKRIRNLMIICSLMTLFGAGIPLGLYYLSPEPHGIIEITLDYNDVSPHTIQPVWGTLNIWDISFLRGDYPGYNVSEYQKKQFFVKHLNIMTATGGRSTGTNEFYSEDATGNPVYNFTALLLAIDWILATNYTATIVIGNTPIALCDDKPIDFGAFDANTGVPNNYSRYFDYIANLTSAVKNRAGNQIDRFEWRIYTEPDNADWLQQGLKNYYPIYITSVKAIRTILPNAIIELGNWAFPEKPETFRSFMQKLILESPDTLPNIVGFSCYGGGQVDYDPRDVGEMVKPWQKILSELALTNISIAIEEGQVLTDFDGVRLWDGDGTEFGAAWNAGVFHECIRNNVSWYAQWNFYAGEVRSASLNVIEMYEKMLNHNYIPADIKYPILTRNNLKTIHSFGALSQNKNSGYLLLSMTDEDHFSKKAYQIRLNVKNIPILKTLQNPTLYIVDRNHSNFFWDQYEIFGQYPRGDFSGKTSVWDLNVAISLHGTVHQQSWYVWGWENRNNYQLETINSPQFKQNADASWSVTFDLPANSVYLWEF